MELEEDDDVDNLDLSKVTAEEVFYSFTESEQPIIVKPKLAEETKTTKTV